MVKLRRLVNKTWDYINPLSYGHAQARAHFQSLNKKNKTLVVAGTVLASLVGVFPSIPAFKGLSDWRFSAKQRKDKNEEMEAEGLEVQEAEFERATAEKVPTQAVFLSKIEAKEKIKERDAFIEALSPFDREARRGFPINEEDFLLFYEKQVQSCHSSTQSKIQKDFEELKPKIEKLGLELPEKIYFIQTSMKEEMKGTLAYCRKDTIVFKSLFKRLLAHELFHIISQNNPELRKKLYACIGYTICPPIDLPEELAKKRIVNPDAPLINAYIKVRYQGKKVRVVPLDFYDPLYNGPGKSSFIKDVYHQFALVEKGNKGKMQFVLDDGHPFLIDFQDVEGLEEQIGENTNYNDSPEEILAENFADLILENEVNSPEILEKMQACF